jgi:hypothetical protein
MKLILTISVILGISLKSAAADGEVGRYQLYAAQVDLGSGPTTKLFRIDTATGETHYLLESNVAIPEAKRVYFGGTKQLSCEGWTRIENSIQEALENTQKTIDSLPEKKTVKASPCSNHLPRFQLVTSSQYNNQQTQPYANHTP